MATNKIIKKKESITIAVDRLYNNLKGAEYGKKYTWDELRTLADIEDGGDDIYYIANKVCLMLMQFDQRYLATEHGFGKKILKPEEHSLNAKHKVKRSVKIYHQAGMVLASTNMDLLTIDQKKQVIEDANKYSTLEMFANEMLNKKQLGTATTKDVQYAGLFLDAIKMFSEKGKIKNS